jgi:nucleotide-binding universal stress UspA family protein
MKILLAVDNSEYSAEAVREVATLPWPQNTMVRVLSVVEPITPPAAELWYDAGGNLERVQQEMTKRARELTASAAEKLKGTELKIKTAVRDGDPRWVIVDEAENWSADLIILGSHGYTGIKRLLLGSVALSVVSHAPCSVEVVRQKKVNRTNSPRRGSLVTKKEKAQASKRSGSGRRGQTHTGVGRDQQSGGKKASSGGRSEGGGQSKGGKSGGQGG